MEYLRFTQEYYLFFGVHTAQSAQSVHQRIERIRGRNQSVALVITPSRTEFLKAVLRLSGRLHRMVPGFRTSITLEL